MNTLTLSRYSAAVTLLSSRIFAGVSTIGETLSGRKMEGDREKERERKEGGTARKALDLGRFLDSVDHPLRALTDPARYRRGGAPGDDAGIRIVGKRELPPRMKMKIHTGRPSG